MSKFVDDIIKDIETNPLNWFEYNGWGCKCGNTKVYGYGNSRFLSLAGVKINGNEMPLSYIDKWKLDIAIGKWYKSVPLSHLQQQQQTN